MAIVPSFLRTITMRLAIPGAAALSSDTSASANSFLSSRTECNLNDVQGSLQAQQESLDADASLLVLNI